MDPLADTVRSHSNPQSYCLASSEALTHLMTLKPKDPPPRRQQEGGLWESTQARTKPKEAVLSSRVKLPPGY